MPCFTHYFFPFRVEIPKGKYKGHKLTKLVTIKIPARIKRKIAIVPEITFPKYRAINIMARSILTILSIEPIFFFMINSLIIDHEQICEGLQKDKTTLINTKTD